MSNKTPTKASETQAQPDVMPEPIDDAADVAAAPEAERAEAEGNQPQEMVPFRRPFDKDRERIFQRARELAAAANKEPEAEPEAEPDAVEEAEPEPVAAKPVAAEAPPALSDDAEIELVVYGTPIKKKVKDLKADAQKLLAADQKFEEAKRIAEEARELLKNAQSRRNPDPDLADQPEGEDNGKPRGRKDAKADQPDIQMDDADLDSIVERIQVGDKEEGRQAVADLAKLIIKGKTSPIDESKVNDIVRANISRADTQREIDSALQRFSQQFPEIVGDDEFVDVAIRRVAKELRDDLKQQGVPDDLINKAVDANDLARLHSEVKKKGAKMRSYDDVLQAAGTHLKSKFGIALKAPTESAPVTSPKPQPTPTRAPVQSTAQQRVEAKRAAIQQPRATGGRAPAPSGAPKPKSPTDYIQELRKARRFTTSR